MEQAEIEIAKRAVEDLIDDTVRQFGLERGDFKMRYIFTPNGEIWADHNIETGYPELDDSIKTRMTSRGVQFNLYFSVSPKAMDYCKAIRDCLRKLKTTYKVKLSEDSVEMVYYIYLFDKSKLPPRDLGAKCRQKTILD